jgi:hypothetical protein
MANTPNAGICETRGSAVLFFAFCSFPTEFLEAYVFRNSYICDAPGIFGIDMRRPRHLLLTLSVKYSCHKKSK